MTDLVKSVIVSVNDGKAVVQVGGQPRNKPLALPKGSSAAAGDYAYLGKCGAEDVIVMIQEG